MAASRVVADERIRATLAWAGDAAVAIGWATVELDRAAAELTAALGLPPDPFEHADDSIVLGAFCRIARGVLAGGRSLLILEPNTEGRLVASLVRLDEGPAAVWLDAIPLGTTVSESRPGPLGPERLVLGDPIHGPHRLVVSGEPGTIAS
jgi:hypothetical protein